MWHGRFAPDTGRLNLQSKTFDTIYANKHADSSPRLVVNEIGSLRSAETQLIQEADGPGRRPEVMRRRALCLCEARPQCAGPSSFTQSGRVCNTPKRTGRTWWRR